MSNDFEIGIKLGTNQKVTYVIPHHGTVRSHGQTRTGKTSLIKSIIANIGRLTNRTLIIIDPYLDWTGLQFPSRTGGYKRFGLPYLQYWPNVKFSARDMDSPFFWNCIRGSEQASEHASRIASESENTSDFIDRVNDFIAGSSSKTLHTAVAGALKRLTYRAEDLLYDESDAEKILNIRKGSQNVFSCAKYPDKKFYAGKLLSLLLNERMIHKLHPVVVIEEASLLAPSMEQYPSASTISCIRAVTQFMRHGLLIYFISQNPSQIAPEIIYNTHSIFSTYCEELKETHSLRYHYPNYREFIWQESGQDRPVYFIPHDMPTA